jgi:hypothetical protein
MWVSSFLYEVIMMVFKDGKPFRLCIDKFHMILIVIYIIIFLQYDLSASQFSPDGRVFQVEYAHKAVENSG